MKFSFNTTNCKIIISNIASIYRQKCLHHAQSFIPDEGVNLEYYAFNISICGISMSPYELQPYWIASSGDLRRPGTCTVESNSRASHVS